MSLDPRPGSIAVPVREAREAARRQVHALPGALVALLGITLALAMVGAFVVLDYRFDQDPHRLVKIVLGAAGLVTIVMTPGLGLLLLPIATPFLLWMPKVPVPGVNPLNILLVSVFATYAITRVFRREPLFRTGSLAPLIGAILVVAAVSIARGAAFPTGYFYNGGAASIELFRSAMTFAVYFICLAMVRGERDRRRMAWAVVLALLAESVVTILYGRNGRGARAEGSIGQSNELGAFLALYTVVAAALVPAVRNWFGRALLAASVVAGSIGVVMSVSRGAFVALAVGLLYVGVRSSRLLTVVTVLVLLSSPFWAPDYVKQRVLGTQIEVEGTDEVTLEASAQARVDTWRAIGTLVTNHPLDGVGFAGLGYVLPETGEALGIEVKDSAHNTFLRFLGEMGLLGLILFVALLWRCWRLAAEGLRAARGRFDRQIAVGLGGATLALALSCAFGDRFFTILVTGNFWMLCALVDDLLLERRAEAA